MQLPSLNFASLKLTFLLIIGIILEAYFSASFLLVFKVSISLVILLGILLYATRTWLQRLIWLDIIIAVTVISIGYLNVGIHNEKNNPLHYTQFKTDNSHNSILFSISEVLKPSRYHDKYIVEILRLNSTKTIGKLLLNVEKDSVNKSLQIDDVYVAKTQLKSLNVALNPYQFNYKAYLNKKQIYRQLSLKYTELQQLESKKNSLIGYASALRETISNRLNDYNFSKDERAIINALLLGQRQDISKSIYESYTKAGAIHILAVSGLHVGIVLMLLQWLFSPLHLLKNGKLFKTISIILVLWCYAFIAGLSPSVVRAVCMFSLFAIGMNLKRPLHIYNTISISAFLLLLFQPLFLFDVGFQMSYLAVLAIVTIKPILDKAWKPKFKIVSFFWNILTVTFAAQVGVLPISLYYFHQFPGLFFLTNIVIIPFLGLILGLGVFTLISAFFKILPEFIADLYAIIISSLNRFVNWVSLQETFIFKNISFSLAYVLLSYFFIVSILILLQKKTYKSLLLALLSVLSFEVYNFLKICAEDKPSFVVFHKNRQSILGFTKNDELHLYHSLSDSLIENEKAVVDFKVGKGTISTKANQLKNVYKIYNKTLLVIDSLGVYNNLGFKPDVLLLVNSPKINVRRLIDSIQPELIISDGSNYKSYQERWKQTCLEKKIPFHQTSKKGAYYYSY